VGGQVGARLGLSHGPVSLDGLVKLALGNAHLVSYIAGNPLIGGASVLPPLVPGPLIALPSNIGRYETNRITVVPEVNLRLRCQVLDHVSLSLGYNVLYWHKVLCPGDQMDQHVNITQ